MTTAKKGFKITDGIWGLAGVALLLLLDQWTKLLAIRHLKEQENVILIPNVLELQYLENRGAAFGMLQNRQWLFILLCAVMFVVILYCFIRIPKNRHYFPLNFIAVVLAAGAAGNFLDRIFRGFVVDFIYFSLIDFPIFNVADICVCVAAGLLVFYVLFYYKDDEFTFLRFRQKGQDH